MKYKKIIKLNSLILIVCFLISAIISVPIVTADALDLELQYYTAADFTTTSTNYISRTPVELPRAPGGYAYVYTTGDSDSGWFNYGFKGINSLDNNAEAVVFWVGQDKTDDDCYLSANYKLNFVGVTTKRKDTEEDFYYIPTNGGEISTSRSKYIYSLFDSDRKHGDFIEGFVVIPLSMYDSTTKKAICEKENLEIHITTNVNKSYVASDGTVINGSATKAQSHYISGLGFITDLDGFLAQFLDNYSGDSVYSNSDENSIFNGLTADMYLHFKSKSDETFDSNYKANAVTSRINQIERLWDKNSTFSYSPFYSVSADDLKNGKINPYFRIGARNKEFLNGLTRETVSGFSAPTITFANNGLRFDWGNYADADRYIISVFDSSGSQVKSVTASTNSAIVTELKLGTTYTFQIDAYNSINYLGSSECVTYEYTAHSIFDGSSDSGLGGNEMQEVCLETSPTGKAIALKGSGTIWQKSYVNSESEIEAIAVWVAQSGIELSGKTYYEQRMIALNVNGNTVYGNSAGEGTAMNYIVPTFGDTAYAVPSTKKMAINKLSAPLTDNAGCYYVFPLTALSDTDREYIQNLVKNGKELRVSTTFGTNVDYFQAGTSSYITNENIKNELKTLENTYYHSNILLISDLEKYLDNNGISAVNKSNSTISIGDSYYSAEKNAVTTTAYADCSFVSTENENGCVKTTFADETDLSDVEVVCSLPAQKNVNNSGNINVKITEKAGFSLSFTADKTGMYYLSSTIVLKSGDKVDWRVVVDSSGRKVHKSGTAFNAESLSFGKGIYLLKKGDRLLMEVYSNGSSQIGIGCPLITLVPVSVKSETVGYSYYYNAFNLSGIYGYNAFKNIYSYQNSNPWRAYAVDNNGSKKLLDTLNITTSTNESNAITSSKCDSAYIRPVAYKNGDYTAQTVITPDSVMVYEFTSPSTGELVLGGIKTVKGISFCTIINGKEGEWQECDGTDLEIKIPSVKTNDKIELKLKNDGNNSVVLTTNLYADLYVDYIIYGDTNADGFFTIKDLVHTKKYYSGIIPDLNSSGSIGNFADKNFAQLLALMRNVLLYGGDISDFILQYE